MFSACNYYAGIATTSNSVAFRSLWSKSALQESVRSHLARAQRYMYSRYTVQIFASSFLKLCASVRPVFLVYSPHAQILPRDWRELFWIIVLVVEKIRKASWPYLQNLSLLCLKRSILETVTDIAKLSSIPRDGNRNYFVAQIGMKSRPRRSELCKKNCILYNSYSPAAHNTFSVGYVRSTA